ncbi:MAG: YihA family ribosome biogenesis GTP-binding protein [Clostridiales bacterium]|nr:YihA family ribosome biogenesis GTP-binding protein [Clostridiales bacterium]
MEIKKAEFVTSAVKPMQYPADNLPCLALAGKSNVGKSSMVNTLTNRTKLAKTSGQPGKTRLINFYRINDTFYIVDLPGYGFARVSHQEKKNWGYMIENFLKSYSNIHGIIHLVDIRHHPTADDKTMTHWFREFNMPYFVLATKADKLGKTRIMPRIKEIRDELGLPLDVQVIPFSSQTGYGKGALIQALDTLINP